MGEHPRRSSCSRQGVISIPIVASKTRLMKMEEDGEEYIIVERVHTARGLGRSKYRYKAASGEIAQNLIIMPTGTYLTSFTIICCQDSIQMVVQSRSIRATHKWFVVSVQRQGVNSGHAGPEDAVTVVREHRHTAVQTRDDLG